MQSGQLIILTGKTASGKDTVMKRVLQNFPGMARVITSTSRAPRPGEKSGEDYNFLSASEFKQKIANKDFLEYVEYGSNLYGTEKEQILKALDIDLIWRIDPSRAGQIRQFIKEAFDPKIASELLSKLLVIYLTVNDDVILQRLNERNSSEEKIQKRMEQDQKFWSEYSQNYDYVVENIPGNLEKCVSEVIQIIRDRIPNNFW